MFHEITIVGTIGREPELRYTADGKASCTFSVASNRKIGQDQTETIWFKITTWEKMAESINKYAHKGQKVFVVGRLVCDKVSGGPRTYVKNDGTTAASFEVVAREFRIVDYGQQAQGQPQQAQTQYRQAQTQPQPQQPQFTEDIPW